MAAQSNGRGVGRRIAGGPNREADIRTFYPSELERDSSHAVRFDVAAGSELSGMDIRVRATRVYSVRGTFVADAETEGTNILIALQLVGGPPSRNSFSIQSTFQLSDVAPGEYDIRTRAVGGGLIQRCTRTTLTVTDSDVNGFVLPLEPCMIVSANIGFESEDAKPEPAVQLIDPEFSNISYFLERNKDGSFAAAGVDKSSYFVDISGLPRNAYVKSVRVRDQDVIHSLLEVRGNTALDVVISTHAATVTAVVKNDHDEPMPGVAVTIWPAIPRAGVSTGGIQTGRTDQNGKLMIPGLAPGEYFMAAWADVATERGLLEYPPFLAGFRDAASGVALVEDAKVSVTLQPISRERIATQIAKLH